MKSKSPKKTKHSLRSTVINAIKKDAVEKQDARRLKMFADYVQFGPECLTASDRAEIAAILRVLNSDKKLRGQILTSVYRRKEIRKLGNPGKALRDVWMAAHFLLICRKDKKIKVSIARLTVAREWGLMPDNGTAPTSGKGVDTVKDSVRDYGEIAKDLIQNMTDEQAEKAINEKIGKV